MFEPYETPRVFGLPPGADFAQRLIDGVLARCEGMPPEALARVEIYVNTRRMQRRIRELFDAGPPRLLPYVGLVTDLGARAGVIGIPPATSPLRHRLTLTQMVAQLLSRQRDLAPKAALFDLADSLASLMEEMQGEGVSPETVLSLDVSDQSGHWQRALQFIGIVQDYFEKDGALSPEARQRMIAEQIAERWKTAPPENPVIIAGSTGSRGATRLLMAAVARLPQGALVLPGYDFDLPGDVWSRLDDALTGEDHPQFRFRGLMSALEISHDKITPWVTDTAPQPSRNRLVSLALRPAPVTDQWMVEGPKLVDLDVACQNLALVEAQSSRMEALAIAFKMRDCAERGERVALITPDRMLTRQVTAALDKWGIEPDDSAGKPLALSAPGRFLRQISVLFGRTLTAEALLALLKHPLSNSGQDQRGSHLKWSRELELHLRRYGPPFPGPDDLRRWAAGADDGRIAWAAWLATLLDGLDAIGTRSLGAHLSSHMSLATALAAGPDTDGAGRLWEEPAGEAALMQMQELEREAEFGGALSPADYASLIQSVLDRGEVHDPVRPHPDVMIWGTLEARVQGSDTVILGGLNDGVWPETPKPDPWLNREMRKQAGLLLPDRRIGLSAHDFQQAIGAKEVWLTRALRDEEAETVPSRWLNRLTNLLGGLAGNGGETALCEMRARGANLLRLASAADADYAPVEAARRPSPRPPVAARPRKLPLTRLKILVRDPYAIYAEYVLRLKPLDPLRHLPDARLRGTVLHSVLERFIRERPTGATTGERDRLMDIAREVLEAEAPWPAARSLWRAKLERVADWFVNSEMRRSAMAQPVALESKSFAQIDPLGFTLTAKADRLDRDTSGRVFVYDYKTGKPPTKEQQNYFDRQLLLTTAMVERGAFAALGPATVAGASFIGLGSTPAIVEAPIDEVPSDKAWAQLVSLMTAYLSPGQGFTARRAMEKERFGGDYDHLSRLGEWDTTTPPDGETLT